MTGNSTTVMCEGGSRMGIRFITLRRRSKKLLDATAQTPASACRAPHRACEAPSAQKVLIE